MVTALKRLTNSKSVKKSGCVVIVDAGGQGGKALTRHTLRLNGLNESLGYSVRCHFQNIRLTRLMLNFQYTAIDKQGQQTTGTVQAESEAEATSLLRSQSLFPTKIVEHGAGGRNGAGKARGGSTTSGGTGGLIVVACGLILLGGGFFSLKLITEARNSEEKARMLAHDLKAQLRHTEELLLEREKEIAELTEALEKQQAE